MKRFAFWVAGFAAAAAAACLSDSGLAGDPGMWRATWETSPVGLPTVTKLGSETVPPAITFRGTVRYRLRVSQGGRQVRLRFSNEYGNSPLSLSAASVGTASNGLDAALGSLHRVTFDGRTSIAIPAGAPALSDPIDLATKPLSDLIVSVYAPEGVSIFDCTPEDSPLDQAGVKNIDATRVEHLSASQCLSMRPIVSEVDVLADRSGKTIVAFGDSITDLFVDPKTGERGWPGALSRRLEKTGDSVVDAGIAGNRLLQSVPMFGASALSRLDRDVFSVPGLSHLIVLEGINDIGMSGAGGMFGDTPLVQPQELIAAYTQIIARAHERGIKVFGATILPFEGAEYYSTDKEKIRSTVNQWIRTSRKFDGVVDFDAAMRDPAKPLRLKQEYDIGDHLHPNSLGYRQMGEVIDLHLFD